MSTRIAVIDRDLCTHSECGYLCMRVCPVNRMGQECIIKEKGTQAPIFPIISEQLCIGCGLCVKKCPMFAISIINLAKELEQPIYQYGINAFRLYGLPLPKEGAVSLVGKNGIGKTTAIRLLSRQIKPNFGDVSKQLNESGMLAKMPIELRRYFERIGKELKMSMKPQYINRVRDAFDGTAKELLQKTVEKGQLKDIAKKFAIEEILDRDIKHLSGGELQKVAVAAAYGKEADIYYFDEVTNYLDIEERLRVGVLLRELAEKKSVLMAEHDLTILDYISSYVHLIYGTENVYGVVSQIKNVRAGINEYLAGFLKEENVRFREYEIGFKGHSEGEVKAPVALEYGKFRKKFKDFQFGSDGGKIRKGEILGLVGKNALGKSLFVKMLAGAEKADEGESLELKVSYKPQYIEAGETTVNGIFEGEAINSLVFEECKRKLKLMPFMDKKLTEISGGELQRVAITLALSREADIYLFDEPTAFLDIEQRFEFASLLRKVISESEKSAFVVDHDIVFIDAIANRLVVFDGKSSVKGHASAPYGKREGMNAFLNMAGITMRRDKDTKRPRINKPGSALDREQKGNNEYYYTD
ncbi:ribosome biogenesis/translation initiation ATPase RLI [Candidatus Micrarchaeota archaeon]|nr:ribosome biogenesis/translation initiation ATPase RLI [Candidatus Micrarchaeota archaeon]